MYKLLGRRALKGFGSMQIQQSGPDDPELHGVEPPLRGGFCVGAVRPRPMGHRAYSAFRDLLQAACPTRSTVREKASS